MASQKKHLIEILQDNLVVSADAVQEVLSLLAESGKSEQEIILERGFATEAQLAEAISAKYDTPMIILNGLQISEDVQALVEYSVLRRHRVMPFAYAQDGTNTLYVAMSDPMDITAIDDISIVTGLHVEPYISTPTDIMSAIDRYYGRNETLSVAEQYTKEREKLNQESDTSRDDEINNSPIVVIVNSMIEQAARQRASDIHVEALAESVRVRYRIDGVLYNRIKYASQLASAIIARIKIISGMDISEKRKPQDGRATYIVDHREYDIRVSCLPTVFGEKCVLRLQVKQDFTRDKRLLGFSDVELKKFDHLLAHPHGIVLITGPTGSGKSTTLYTALSELNSESTNIITVEDPVEANIDGINQVQVNTKADMTFANALRSILRQDPDIIMIGEIRDTETAMIAVQASITGHLVVSTLHTNSSASSITRLLDMGVDSYLIADSVVGIIAQRLVRRLCPHCKRKKLAEPNELAFMGLSLDSKVDLYESVGCQRCNQTGFTGRIGVYEILEVTPEIKYMISRKENANTIKKAAIENGMSTLRASATRLALEGITSFRETLNVSFED
ncbi:MAG: type II/IV secretion system protein [Clostridia bacterium]|nr:type II/IV secretion system protein [Clostridia bacterium]